VIAAKGLFAAAGNLNPAFDVFSCQAINQFSTILTNFLPGVKSPVNDFRFPAGFGRGKRRGNP
jgi:hypothetical protein